MRGSSWAGRLLAAAVLGVLALPASAMGHAERPSYYPNFDPVTKQFLAPFGRVPTDRSNGARLVVCKSDSEQRINKLPDPAMRAYNTSLWSLCRFRHIQQAVDAAKTGERILIMPGVYREQPSTHVPNPDTRCADMYVADARGGGQVPAYEYHYNCPQSQNLIAITGDDPDDADRRCDQKCNLLIEGTARRRDVLISGARDKLNVIRADRADGIYLRNFTIEFSDFNNIYALETNGFRFEDIESRYSREYGFLSFASDQGLYNRVTAYRSGDSGIYPGSGPEGHCKRYGIEIKNSDSHHNNLGYSGTAGNGVWAHDNKFHHNGTGLVTDSFASGHPGMPQDCAKWENNEIYSNNYDLFNDEQDAYCKNTPWPKRKPNRVCPTFQNPVGTGILIAGGNANIARHNRIYDNWRQGVALFFVPAELRGDDSTGQSENNDTDQADTSHDNKFANNVMGVNRKGQRDPNGVDFWWDEQGSGNCWQGNVGPGGAAPTNNFPLQESTGVTDCPGSPVPLSPNPAKSGFLVPCATWDPSTEGEPPPADMTDPPGCRMGPLGQETSWFEVPPEPQ